MNHYSAPKIEDRIVSAIRSAGLDPDKGLSEEQLGALDHLHTGGRRATRELLGLVRIQPEDVVLDVGAGLGGPARLVASTYGCRVVCLEPSPDYRAAAKLLNQLTGLDDRIEVRSGRAPNLPFPQSSFDLVWMQNVGVNIADKDRLYAEAQRVLRPGGRFVFQEVAAGEAGEPYFPLPWATGPAESFLTPADQIRSLLERNGFVAETFEDNTAAEVNRPPASTAQSPLTLAVYVENFGEKSRNSRRSLEERRARVVFGIFRAV